MLEKTVVTSIDTQAARLRQLQDRVEKINNQKVAAETRFELLEQQYKALVEKIQQKGVNDVADLPAKIAQLEQEINTELNNLEERVVAVEQLMNSVQ